MPRKVEVIRRKGKVLFKVKTSAVGGVDFGLSSTRWLMERVGATHPTRLALAVAMTICFYKVAAAIAAQTENAFVTSLSQTPYPFFGLCFCVMFFPLMFARNRIPEDAMTYFAVIEFAAKKAKWPSRIRSMVYTEVLQAIATYGPVVWKVDFDEIKKHYKLPSTKSEAVNSETREL